MNEDNSISTKNNNYLENVKDLISHIKSLESQIKELKETLNDKEREKRNFDINWRVKCNHPEFFKITIPEERIPSLNKNDPYYELTKHLIERALLNDKLHPHPEKIFCRCSVCGLEIDETESVEYIQELEIKSIIDYRNFDLKPISDSARNLYHKKTQEFTFLEEDIKALNSKYEKLQEELNRLKKEANEIAEILNSKLGIKHIEYINHYPFGYRRYDD